MEKFKVEKGNEGKRVEQMISEIKNEREKTYKLIGEKDKIYEEAKNDLENTRTDYFRIDAEISILEYCNGLENASDNTDKEYYMKYLSKQLEGYKRYGSKMRPEIIKIATDTIESNK